MLKLKHQIKLAVWYFFIAATLGFVLRSFHLFEIQLKYRFIVHAHSHIALLGWVYVALSALIYSTIRRPVTETRYRKIFWFTQITLIGMLITFPLQGYGLFSILFSTFFLFASYWFHWFFLSSQKLKLNNGQTYLCLKMALFYLSFSSIGPWSLGAIMNTLGPESVWYRMSIYFFLHFQYNGWMTLALVGLLIYALKEQHHTIPQKKFNSFFLLINMGIVLSFLLSALFTESSISIHILGGIGALIQLIAFTYLTPLFFRPKSNGSRCTSLERYLLKLLFFMLMIKLLLQLVSAFPYFSKIINTSPDFIIGYLHWTFLGVISPWLLFLCHRFKLLRVKRISLYLYILGFIVTEGLIFYKGSIVRLNVPLFDEYYLLLAIASFFICFSLLTMMVKPHTIMRKHLPPFK